MVGRHMLRSVMETEYELFERRADGVLNWRGLVQGLSAARVRTRLLAIETENEVYALRSLDRVVVARVAPHEVVAEVA